MSISFLSEKRKFLLSYYILFFLRGFFFLKQYLVILLDNTLNSIQVSFVLSLTIATNVLLSIPISTLASKFGNKKVFLTGTFLFFLSYILLLFNVSIYTYIVYAVCSGIFDITFMSSNEGLVYENIKKYGLTKRFAEYKSVSKFCKFMGMAISGFLAGDLVYENPKIIFMVDTVVLIVAMIAIYGMDDTSCTKVVKLQVKKPLKYIWRHKTLMKAILHRIFWHSFFLFLATYKSLYFEELAVNDANVNVMVTIQMVLAMSLQVFVVKKLSKKSIFFNYGLFIVAGLFAIMSFYNYSGILSYILIVIYFIMAETTGDVTYSNMISFMPRSEMAMMLALTHLGNNLGKLIFVNSFGIISHYVSHRTAFLTLGAVDLLACIILFILIKIDKHMKNVDTRFHKESI